jgi:NADP-dependent 3-hydroxy acid dehydrogenase YdfG
MSPSEAEFVSRNSNPGFATFLVSGASAEESARSVASHGADFLIVARRFEFEAKRDAIGCIS